MPRRLGTGPLRPRRHCDLGQPEDDEGEVADLRPADQKADDPADLDECDAGGEPDRDSPADRILTGRTKPLSDECDPHHDVARDHRREVLVFEGSTHTGGDDEHSRDLHEREQPVLDVVRVVRRGEPGEVHPGPPDREEDDQEVDQAVPHLSGDEVVVEGVRRTRHGDDETQVEQELERRRRSVRLCRVAASHRDVPGTLDLDPGNRAGGHCQSDVAVALTRVESRPSGAVATCIPSIAARRSRYGRARSRSRISLDRVVAAMTSGAARERTVAISSPVIASSQSRPRSRHPARASRYPECASAVRPSSAASPARIARRSMEMAWPWTRSPSCRSIIRRSAAASRRHTATRPARNRWAVPPIRSRETSSTHLLSTSSQRPPATSAWSRGVAFPTPICRSAFPSSAPSCAAISGSVTSPRRAAMINPTLLSDERSSTSSSVPSRRSRTSTAQSHSPTLIAESAAFWWSVAWSGRMPSRCASSNPALA